MTSKQYDEIVNDKTWIKISFLSECGRGEIILKTSMYNHKQKKIEKMLKGLTYYIDYDYKLAINEVMMFDPELNRLKNFDKSLHRSLNYAMQVSDEEYIKELNDKIDNNLFDIGLREQEIIEAYGKEEDECQ